MVPDQFPIFRLGTLLARQLSSPIASRLKLFAAKHPWFRRALVGRAGRVYRRAEFGFKMWMLRLGRPPRAPPLSDAEATQVGADIIGEMIIFGLGSAIVVFEVNRQAMNKELKEMEQKSRWVALGAALEELQREVVLQQRELDRLHDALHALAPTKMRARAPPAPPPPAGGQPRLSPQESPQVSPESPTSQATPAQPVS